MSLVGMPGYQETPAGWIPHDWMATTLGAVADFKGGNAFKEKFQGKKAGDFPFIKVSDFSLPLNQKFIRDANNWIDADTNKEIKATLFEQGAVVFAKVGAALLLNRRRVLTRKTAIDNNLMAATPRTIDPTFLYFHLQTVDFGKLVQDGAVPSVNQGQLQALPLAQPPLAEQQKVAAILTAVDDKLDVIARQIEATETLKQGLMQTLFSRGVGTQDADGRWVPHTEFKDSELGEIPVGWEVTTVGAVCEVKGGKRLPKGEVLTDENTGYPYIRVTDMYMGGVNTDGILYVPAHVQPSIARYTISKDDIFISVAGTLGLVGVIPDDLDGANLTENADKLTDIKICRDFLLHCLCADGIQGAIAREGTANAQPKLALTRIREFLLPLPPRPEQERIATILRSVGEKLATLQGKEKRYLALKRGLMQKLLTGEWRVSVDTSATGA